MNLKTAAEDFADPRPIKKVTAYAAVTALQGLGFGLLLPMIVGDFPLPVRLGIGISCWLLGAILAVSAYSALKRRFAIVEIPPNGEEEERR